MAEEGEEWKGESSEPFGYGLFSMFGKAPTAEEKARWERERLERVAEGNALFDMLPMFDESRRCPKCRAPKLGKITFCAGASTFSSVICQRTAGEHEHLHVTCSRCGYDRIEKPLDYEGA